MKDDNITKESLLSRLEVFDVKELSKEELARMAKWKKTSQELLEKGASSKDLMGAYEEIFDFEKEVSIQSAKDLLKGIFDDDDDEPAAAAAASLSKTKDDDDDPFSLGGGGPPPTMTISKDDNNPGPGGGGVGALAEPIRVPVSEKQAEKSEDIYDKVFPDSPTMDSPAFKERMSDRLTILKVGKPSKSKKESEEPSLDR